MEEHKNTNECEDSCDKKQPIITVGNYYISRTVLTESRAPLNITQVAETLKLEKGRWIIIPKTFLIKGEVISVGKLQIKYRIVKEMGFSSKTNYPRYEIKKICGDTFSTLDESNASVGAMVKIVSRKTESKVFEILNKLQ